MNPAQQALGLGISGAMHASEHADQALGDWSTKAWDFFVVWAKEMMVSAVGPVGGIFTDRAKGIQMMSEGDYARGLEAMAPSSLRGPLKAIRYADEGNIDRKSKIVVSEDVSGLGILGQAMGLMPTEVRRAYEGKSAISQYDRSRMD